MKTLPVSFASLRLLDHRLIGTEVDDSTFLAYAEELGAVPNSVVLLSGGDHDCSRYSIAGCNPFMIFKSKGNLAHIELPGGTITLEGDPLDILDRAAASLHPDFPLLVPPFSGGAMGYFAYDLKNCIEALPQTAVDDLGLPDVFLIWPRTILVHDRHERLLFSLTLSCDESSCAHPPSCPPPLRGKGAHAGAGFKAGPLKSNFTHSEYLEAVGCIRHYIGEGDVYQVNLSQRFSFPFSGDPFTLWKSLFTVNPAPFYAFVHAGDHCVLSTSMERFLYRNGHYIETRPIKGTRKRGKSVEEDLALRSELSDSPKDDAELSMIVDLLRNDLGRVCRPRSIGVVEHKRVEAYENVWHLVSIVAGQLRPGVSSGELLRATFPGGSITGCPKIRAMEIIDELEPHVRHIYTGAIGYLGWHDNLDLNVAIRTALLHRQTCHFSVGGGIVYDSQEEDEYQETLHKGRTIFKLIEKPAGALR